MNDITLEERVWALETAVYNLIHEVNKLKEEDCAIDVVTMVSRLKEYREMERFLDTHNRVVAALRNTKGEVI